MYNYKDIHKLVCSLANKHSPFPLVEDAIQNGWLGVEEAKLKFDPSRDIKFTTFAYRRIKGSIINRGFTLYTEVKYDNRIVDSVIEETVSINSLLRNLKKVLDERELYIVKEKVLAERGATELSAELGVSRQRVDQIYTRAISKSKEYLIGREYG